MFVSPYLIKKHQMFTVSEGIGCFSVLTESINRDNQSNTNKLRLDQSLSAHKFSLC